MKAIILARVSTSEQMEGQSIPAQISRARAYVKKKGLDIKNEYQFDESSIKDKRKKFEQVIKEIKQSKEKIALITETVDRLQRSFKESVLLDELRKQGKLEIHFIRENLVIHKDSNSSEIQRWDLAVFVAKSYVLQISDNVKRSIEQKIKNGVWICNAPIGYLNCEDERGNKDVIPDPVRSPYIARMFEMYASGNSSLNTIKEEMERLGLKSSSKSPKPLTVSMIGRTLKNPFYHGVMKIKGELYPHKHQPIISEALFDKVQEVMNGYHKKPFQYAAKPYIFRGLIKCADCGCTITGETSKGHIYYSCTNYHKFHKKRIYVREEDLLIPVYKILNGIQLPDEKIKEITEDLKKTHEAKNHFHEQTLTALRQEYDQIERRISSMLDVRFDGFIGEEMFNKKLKEYKHKQKEINYKIQRYSNADEKFYLTANMVLSLAQRALKIFKSSEVHEKRQLLNFLLQNLKLKDKTLQYKLKTPFDTVLAANNFPLMLGDKDSNLD